MKFQFSICDTLPTANNPQIRKAGHEKPTLEALVWSPTGNILHLLASNFLGCILLVLSSLVVLESNCTSSRLVRFVISSANSSERQLQCCYSSKTLKVSSSLNGKSVQKNLYATFLVCTNNNHHTGDNLNKCLHRFSDQLLPSSLPPLSYYEMSSHF